MECLRARRARSGWPAPPCRPSAQELTIFWAEWDPANYLQELVNEYTAETGVTVTVQTTPWSDFQTKTFAELNAHGDAYDMVVGDSQWLGAGSTGGHYVDLSEFFDQHNLDDVFVPATIKYYSEYDGKNWAVPVEGDANGWAYRKDWFEDPAEMAAFKEKYGYELAVPKDYKELRDIAEFFHRPDENRYGLALYTQTSYDALAMGVEQTIFTYGGDLGDYAAGKAEGIINSPQNVEALELYRDLYQFTPPNWGQAFFLENNQAFTEGLVAMTMNYFAFFPALANPATNPHAESHRLLREPARTDRRAARGARRPGRLDRLLLAEPGGGLQVPRVVHPRGRAEEVGRARRLHLPRRGARVRRSSATPRRSTRPSTSRCRS